MIFWFVSMAFFAILFAITVLIATPILYYAYKQAGGKKSFLEWIKTI